MAGDTGTPMGGDQQEGKAVLTVVSETQQATSNITDFGQKATQTFTQVGEAAEKSASKTRDATARAIAALQRQAAEYKAVAEGITKVEALGQIRRDVKQNELAPVLEQLRQYKAAAEQVAAAEKQLADATKLRAVVAEAANAREKAAYNEQLNILEKLRAAAAVGQNKRDQKEYSDQLKREAQERAALDRQQEIAQERADKLHATVLEAQNKRERAAYEERARNTQRLIELVQRLRNEQEKAAFLKGEQFLENLRNATAIGSNKRDQKAYTEQLREEALARERADRLHATVLEAQNRREKAAYEERARNTQKLIDLVTKLRQEQEKQAYVKGQDFQAALAAQNTAMERQAQLAGKSATEILALEVAEKRLQASLLGVGQAAEAQILNFQRLKQAQIDAANAVKGDDFIRQLQNRITAGTSSPYDQLIEQARKLGRLREAEPLIKQLAQIEKGFTDSGKAARLAAQQMALVAPQITDIVTMIEMGANPLTILVQQGGQLIDVFGGIRAAASGLGRFLWAQLTNPIVLAAGAVIGLGAAYAAGEKESAVFARSLSLTGNAAGLTEGRFNALAKSIADSTETTIGSTRDTLQAMVSSGQLTGEALAKATATAQLFAKVTGESTDTIAKKFIDAAESPARFAAELNKTYNFLNAAQMQQIKNMADQGRTQEALVRTFDLLNVRLQDAAQHFGTLERWWDTLKRKGSQGIDFVLRIGRVKSVDEMLADVESDLQKARDNAAGSATFDPSRFGGNAEARASGRAQERVRELEAQKQALILDKEQQDQNADAAAKRIQNERAVATAIEEQNKYKDKQQQLDKALLDYSMTIKRALEDPLTDQNTRDQLLKNYQRNIDEIRDRFKESPGPKGSKAPFNDANRAEVEAVRQTEQLKQEEIRRSLDLVGHLRDMERISERQAIEDIARLEIESLRARAEALRQQADIVAKKENATGEAAALRRQAALIDSQVITRQRRETQQLAEAQERLIQASNAEALRQYTQAQEEETAAIRDATVARTEYHAAQLDQARTLDEAQRALDLEATLIGKSDDARRVALETLRIQIALERELDDIRLNRGNDPDAIAQAQANAAKATALVQQRATLEIWDQTSGMIQDTLTDAIIEGGDAGAKALERMFKQLVLRPIVSAIVQPIAGTLGAAAAGILGGGGAGGGGSGAGAVLNGASSLSSIYNAYTGASIAGLGTTISGIGSFFGSSSMAAYGAGMGMTSAQAAAAAAAYQSAAAAGGASAATYAATGSAISAGSATGSALTTIGSYIPYVAAVLAVLNAFGVFRSNKAVGAGLVGTVGTSGDLDSYTLMRRGGTLFSGPSYSIRTQDADPNAVRPIQDAVMGMLAQFRQQAGTIGLGGNLSTFTAPLGSDLIHPEVGRYGIKLDGLKPEEITKKVQEEITKLGEKMAEQALGGEGGKLAKAGESATQTLARLSNALLTVNQALYTFRDNMLGNNLSGADIADKLLELFGGADAFNQVAQQYYQAFYSDGEKLDQAMRELRDGFAKLGVQLPESRAGLRSLIEAQDLNLDSGRRLYAGLMQLAPAFDAVTKAAEEQREAELERQRAISQERAGIEQQILQLEGKKQELRERELAQLDPSNRALQWRLYALQDMAELNQQAMARQSERTALENQLLQLQGNTAELRRREIAALDPWNQGMQRLIFQLQDQQAEAEKARAILEERKGLEQQLLELQGNTTELRRRELETLDPSNRALQEQINALRDATEAAQKAKEVREAWKQVGDTLAEEIRRIRGLSAESAGGGYAFMQAQFAVATAQARAGDQEAAQRLPELSAALLKAAADSASTAAELATIQGATANSLEQTMKMLQSLGVEVPGFAAGGLFGGGMRIVGERGPELEVTGPARIFSAQQTASILSGGLSMADLQRVIDAIDRLHESMRIGHGALASNTARAATVLEAVAPQGEFLNVKEFTE